MLACFALSARSSGAEPSLVRAPAPPLAAPAPVSQVLAPLAIDPSWPKTLTVITDSVAVVVGNPLRTALPGWHVTVKGRPALMVNQAVPEFFKGKNVGSVVVVGLGYNSQFEKNRKNAARWVGMWDYRAELIVKSLEQRGAKKIIWITLREPSLEVVTRKGQSQYDMYAWFFPYVNERIRALAERHSEVSVADWASVSNVPDVTVDLIHLNKAGAKLMADVIARSVLGPAQADSSRSAPSAAAVSSGS